MKSKALQYITGMISLAIGLLASQSALAAGLLTPTNSNLPQLEIRDHEVTVTIEDGYAITRVEQVFYNPHAQDLEARYSFPIPEKASMAELTLWIDGKPVHGEVLEKQEARKVYEEEKQAGRETALTEQDSYKTFETMVSPIRAGKETRIRLAYIQPAHVDTGIGRYVYPLEEGGVDEQKLSFWTANEKVTRKFSFNLKLKSAYPVDAVRVPGQQASVKQTGTGEWTVSIGSQATPSSSQSPQQETASQQTALTPVATGNVVEGGQQPAPAFNPQAQTGQAVHTLNSDLVVYWRHKAGLPGSVDLVTYKPDPSKRGTFMMVVTPGDDLKPIKEGKDWVFVLDISGSMQGKYATLADGVQKALKKMRPNDRFRIVLFNNSARDLTPSYITATPENIRHWSQQVGAIHPGGGTNLYAGLMNGIKHLDADRTSAVVLVTDGVANVGETHQRKFIELVKKADVRLFTMIMGNSSNRPMLTAMTRESGGFAISISNSDDIVGQILKASSKVTHEALHGVKVKIRGIKTADITPKQIGSLYRGQQLVVFGHYWGDGQAHVEVSGKVSGTPKTYQSRFNVPASSKLNPEIERLWAYASIEDMMEEINNFGEKADIKNAIISLGVEYGLVTDYTSMIVMRDEVFTSRKINRTNKRRLTIEHAAQTQRQARPAPSRRADKHDPMFKMPRPNFGGGAIDPLYLVLLGLMAILVIRLQRAGNKHED